MNVVVVVSLWHAFQASIVTLISKEARPSQWVKNVGF